MEELRRAVEELRANNRKLQVTTNITCPCLCPSFGAFPSASFLSSLSSSTGRLVVWFLCLRHATTGKDIFSLAGNAGSTAAGFLLLRSRGCLLRRFPHWFVASPRQVGRTSKTCSQPRSTCSTMDTDRVSNPPETCRLQASCLTTTPSICFCT